MNRIFKTKTCNFGSVVRLGYISGYKQVLVKSAIRLGPGQTGAAITDSEQLLTSGETTLQYKKLARRL